jgi:hypothetical protein
MAGCGGRGAKAVRAGGEQAVGRRRGLGRAGAQRRGRRSEQVVGGGSAPTLPHPAPPPFQKAAAAAAGGGGGGAHELVRDVVLALVHRLERQPPPPLGLVPGLEGGQHHGPPRLQVGQQRLVAAVVAHQPRQRQIHHEVHVQQQNHVGGGQRERAVADGVGGVHARQVAGAPLLGHDLEVQGAGGGAHALKHGLHLGHPARQRLQVPALLLGGEDLAARERDVDHGRDGVRPQRALLLQHRGALQRELRHDGHAPRVARLVALQQQHLLELRHLGVGAAAAPAELRHAAAVRLGPRSAGGHPLAPRGGGVGEDGVVAALVAVEGVEGARRVGLHVARRARSRGVGGRQAQRVGQRVALDPHVPAPPQLALVLAHQLALLGRQRAVPADHRLRQHADDAAVRGLAAGARGWGRLLRRGAGAAHQAVGERGDHDVGADHVELRGREGRGAGGRRHEKRGEAAGRGRVCRGPGGGGSLRSAHQQDRQRSGCYSPPRVVQEARPVARAAGHAQVPHHVGVRGAPPRPRRGARHRAGGARVARSRGEPAAGAAGLHPGRGGAPVGSVGGLGAAGHCWNSACGRRQAGAGSARGARKRLPCTNVVACAERGAAAPHLLRYNCGRTSTGAPACANLVPVLTPGFKLSC